MRRTCGTTAYGMSVDPSGNAFVVGVNRGNDFPVRRAPQPDNAAGPMVVSEDGGRTWLVASGLRANVVHGIAWITEARPNVYAASDRGLFVSTDFGRRWTERAAVATRDVRAVAVDPVTPPVVYASIATNGTSAMNPDRPGGLFKSLDAGQSWTAISSGYQRDRSRVYPVDCCCTIAAVNAVHRRRRARLRVG